MTQYKNKYLRAELQETKEVVTRIDVSHLTMKAIDIAWDEMAVIYQQPKYNTAFETSQRPLRTF